MAKIIKPLTVTEVKNAKPEDSPLRDGGGLLLDISPVSKRWRFDYRKPFSGKRTDTAIYLKEEQKHYFKAQVGNRYDFYTKASYFIVAYGDKLEALERDWYSSHLGYQMAEPVSASQAYKAIQPTLVFNGTDLPLGNDPDKRTFMEGFRVEAGDTVEVFGVKFVCENTAQVANGAGWYTSCFRGSGNVILNGCTIVQRDFEHGHFYLANSTVGQLTISLRYLIIGGAGVGY